jgi:hypothetical protein
MSISGAALPEYGKQLSIAWQNTREKWRDAKAAEFEKRFMEDLPGEMKRAASVIEELDKLLKKVRSDCE